MSSKKNLSNEVIIKNDNKLLNIKRFLKKYDLLNNKNLIKRKNIYYFSFYLQKDKNIQYSLNTNDFLLSNILKYKILIKIEERLKKMGLKEDYLKQFNTNLTVIKTDKGFLVEKDKEDEESIVENITNKSLRVIKKSKVEINKKSNIEIKYNRRSRNNIKKHIDLFVEYFKIKNKNKKTVESYIKKYELLIDYFNYKNILSLNEITKKDCYELEKYLFQIPSNLNKQEELKDKNIFELIDKKDKILNKYEKKLLNKRTVDNYITRYKTLFNYFHQNDYIHKNHFLDIKKNSENSNNSFKDFITKEDTYNVFEYEEIELLLKNIEDKEIKKLIILSLSSGLRSSECFNLKKEDFLKIKDNYFVSVKKSKTKSGIRQVPISDFFTFFIDDLLKNKKNEEYIFFNDEQKENRNDNLQKKVMRQIRKYIKDKNKVFHSLRKNYTQLLYKNDTDELYIKLFLGHSYKDNLSFNTYNLSKVDNKLKIQTINNVDFSEIFENINFYDKEREEKRINDEKLKQHTKYELSL